MCSAKLVLKLLLCRKAFSFLFEFAHGLLEEQLDGPGEPVLLDTSPESYGKPPKVNLMLPSCLSAACRSSLPE